MDDREPKEALLVFIPPDPEEKERVLRRLKLAAIVVVALCLVSVVWALWASSGSSEHPAPSPPASPASVLGPAPGVRDAAAVATARAQVAPPLAGDRGVVEAEPAPPAAPVSPPAAPAPEVSGSDRPSSGGARPSARRPQGAATRNAKSPGRRPAKPSGNRVSAGEPTPGAASSARESPTPTAQVESPGDDDQALIRGGPPAGSPGGAAALASAAGGGPIGTTPEAARSPATPARAPAHAAVAAVAPRPARAAVERRLADAAATAIVRVGGPGHGGAGFVADPAGYIVTSYRVANAAAPLAVTLHDGRTLPVRIVARDPAADVAVLKADAIGLAAVTLGSAKGLRAGDPVLAVGQGSGRGREVMVGSIRDPGAEAGDVLATDLPGQGPRPGGLLLNARGEAIGIATSGAARRYAAAVAIDRVKPMLDDLKLAAGVRLRPIAVSDR